MWFIVDFFCCTRDFVWCMGSLMRNLKTFWGVARIGPPSWTLGVWFNHKKCIVFFFVFLFSLVWVIYHFLWPFQFNSFMMVIRDMLSRMEAEHKTKLEQLHVMQEQQRCLSIITIIIIIFFAIDSIFSLCLIMNASQVGILLQNTK